MNITHYKVWGKDVQAVKSENINTVTLVKSLGFRRNSPKVLMFFLEKSSEKLSKHCHIVRKRFLSWSTQREIPCPQAAMLTKKSNIMKMISTSVFVSFLWQGLVKSMGEEPVVLPNLSKCIQLKGVMSSFFNPLPAKITQNIILVSAPSWNLLNWYLFYNYTGPFCVRKKKLSDDFSKELT